MTETNKNYKRSQRGRSMVEMLGVLSIIGVLSVGGISAYSTAMEKHKANELMAATMQEAVLISAQLATGKTNPTLSGINNSLFASASTVANSDNFKIALNAVDEDVCEKMKSMLSVSSMVHKISDNCGEMTFHKNLTPKAVVQAGGNSGGSGSESGGNSGEGGTTEPTDPCADVDCGDNATCVNGACKCENGWTGELCDTKDCSIYTDGGACDSNGCIPIYFEQQNYFGCYNSAKEALDEANKNSCLIGGIGPYYSNAFHCNTGLNFTAALPCFYPDKYTCDSGLAKQCKNGTWNKIELCLSGCRNILGSSVDEICDALDD